MRRSSPVRRNSVRIFGQVQTTWRVPPFAAARLAVPAIALSPVASMKVTWSIRLALIREHSEHDKPQAAGNITGRKPMSQYRSAYRAQPCSRAPGRARGGMRGAMSAAVMATSRSAA
jgi:hypothetical protein